MAARAKSSSAHSSLGELADLVRGVGHGYGDEDAIIRAVLSHRMVRTKTQADGLTSANFSEEAFQKAHWDDLSMLARGLFVEQEGRVWRVRGRSYHKFFYEDERGVPFMARAELPRMLVFPLTCYVKENGFLGIVFGRPGRNGAPAELVAASKSTTAGPFAERLRAMVVAHLAARGVTPEQLAEQLAADNVSLVFEAIDPVFDPHIIKYARAKLVLLDVIVNQLAHFVRWTYDELQALGASYGLEVKRRYGQLANLAEYNAFHNRCMDDEDFMVDGHHVEGFVIEGQDGFMLKIKSAFYTNWKRVRTLMLPLAHGKPLRPTSGTEPTVANALKWLAEPAHRAYASMNVIALRDLYWASLGRAPEPATDGDEGHTVPASAASAPVVAVAVLPVEEDIPSGASIQELTEDKVANFVGLVRRVHRDAAENRLWPTMQKLRRPFSQAWTVWAIVHALRQPALLPTLADADLVARWRAGGIPPLPRAAPVLFVCVGLPGMGKSTLSDRLGRLLSITRLSQDDCGGKAAVFLPRLQALLTAQGAAIADRNNHDAPRRKQVIDIAKAVHPATVIIALSFEVPAARGSDVLPMLQQRITDRGEKHPTLKASSNVAAVLGSFSASFRPVRFWARSAEAIARWPTGDRADADGDVDYLIDEQVMINPRPAPDTVFATTVDALRPILAQLDRFAAIDVSPEAVASVTAAMAPTTAAPDMASASSATPKTPPPRTNQQRGDAGRSTTGPRASATTNKFAALALDDEDAAAEARSAAVHSEGSENNSNVDDDDDDDDLDHYGVDEREDAALWSSGKGSPWSNIGPSKRRTAHASSKEAAFAISKALPRYYALQLLPEVVPSIADRLAAVAGAASLSTYDSLAPMFTNGAPHVTLLYLDGQRPERLSAHNLALLQRLQAAEGQPYTIIATHVLQNDHCCCLATTVPGEWMDDRFGRADGTRLTGAPTHHITLALSHNRRAFYANMLVERAFWNVGESDKVHVYPLDPPLALDATVVGMN